MFFSNLFKSKPAMAKGEVLSTSLEANLRRFKLDIFADNEIVMFRKFRSASPKPRECVLIFNDYMAKHEFLSHYVLQPMMEKSIPARLEGKKLVQHIMNTIISADGVDFQASIAELTEAVLSGSGVVLIDGCDLGIVVDAQGWEKRKVSEPPTANVVRGPRVGFTEELGVGLALLRRRIKCPSLKFRYFEVGTQTRTKVAISYIEGLASEKLVDEVITRIEEIEIDGVLDSGYIEELIRDTPFTPLPTIGSSERPDVVAARLLEGRVAILVDGSPFALTVPHFFVENFQASEDYYKNWINASFQRLLRYICFFLTTSTPALYLVLINYHPQLIPTELVLSISAARMAVPFPAVVEVTAMGLMFEILREAGIRLPQPIGDAISIVGAIVLGEAAVSANLVSAPMIIVVGVTGISGFATPSLHGSAIIIRFILVILSSIFGLYGYLFGAVALLLHLATIHSFGAPYLTGYISFFPQDTKDTLLRAPWWGMLWRPRFLATRNKVRMRDARS